MEEATDCVLDTDDKEGLALSGIVEAGAVIARPGISSTSIASGLATRGISVCAEISFATGPILLRKSSTVSLGASFDDD